jgi:prefoldin beta subunit
MRKTMGSRQQLESQLRENQIVKDELHLLQPCNTVYKLIGPALVKQDLEEAKQTVEKRLEYITKEMSDHGSTLEDFLILSSSGCLFRTRCEDTIKDLEGKLDQKRQKLMKLQSSLQAQQAAVQKQKPT